MLDKSKLTYLNKDNIDAGEIARFDKLAASWWDPNGQYKQVLAFNAARWQLIHQQLKDYFTERNLSELSALDVGCGGGLLCEPLARLGITVTGADASATSIAVAQRHAQQSGLAIEYRHCLAGELIKDNRQFDIVVNTEVIEHVPDQQALLDDCCCLLKPGGLLVLATLNRTIKSYIVAIVGAEYVMRMLPVGTHSWKAFVKPHEMRAMLRNGQCDVFSEVGLKYNPFTKAWRKSRDLSVNYLQFAAKKAP